MKTSILWVILLMGLTEVTGASGQLEYVEKTIETPGTAVDELTPLIRTYLLPSSPLSLRAAGPFELEITSADTPFLTLEAHAGLLYQTSTAFKDGVVEILLEPGLTGPLERGRLKARLGTGHLSRISLRKGTVATLNIRQTLPLLLELRDQVFLKGNLELPVLEGLASWKSEVRLSGRAGEQIWTVQGLSSLRMPEMQWEALVLRGDEGGRIFLGSPGRISGSLRNQSLLEVPEGGDLTGLQIREGSRIEIRAYPAAVPKP